MKKVFLRLFLILILVSPGISFCYDSGWVNGEPVNIYKDKEIFDSIKNLIKKAKNSIDIEMYEFQDWEIADMLIKRSKEKVKVRVIMDKSVSGNGEIKKYLSWAGIDARYYPVRDKAINHVKIIVIDNSTAAITGANLGLHSICNHDIGVVFSGEAALHADKIFEDDWAYSTGSKKKALKPDEKNKGKNRAYDLRILTDKDIEKRVNELISRSKKNIKIAMFALSDYEIMKNLANAEKRGVDVRIMLDKNIEINYKTAKYLKSGKISVKWFLADDSIGQKMHMKLALFDDNIAFMGSANLSYHGLQINHECSIIISNKEIAGKLSAIFENDFKSATLIPVGKLPEKGKN